MNTIDRYVLRGIVAGTLMVMLVLVGLSSFITFIRALDDIGRGSYELGDAILQVVLSVPPTAYEVFPVAALLGAMLGLGNLAAHSELIVLRAAGVSVWRLATSVFFAGLVLMALAVALGELVAPSSDQFAERIKALRLHDGVTLAGDENAWIKDGEVIVNIQTRMANDQLGGVYFFSFDADDRLSSIGRAVSAGFGADEQWYLNDLRESRFLPEGVVVDAAESVTQPTTLSPELLDLSVVKPSRLDSRSLFDYTRYLRAQKLDAFRYEMVFWSRLANMAAMPIVTVLALPFMFGSLRSTGTGARLTVGVLIGVGWFVGSQTLQSSGAVFDVDAVIVAWLPTLVLAGATFGGLLRVR